MFFLLSCSYQADAILDPTFAESLFAQFLACGDVQLAGCRWAHLLSSGHDLGPCPHQCWWTYTDGPTSVHNALCRAPLLAKSRLVFMRVSICFPFGTLLITPYGLGSELFPGFFPNKCSTLSSFLCIACSMLGGVSMCQSSSCCLATVAWVDPCKKFHGLWWWPMSTSYFHGWLQSPKVAFSNGCWLS